MAANNYPGKNVYFNGNNLAGITGLLIYSVDIYQSPGRNNETYKLARSHGQKIVSQYYDQKQIIVKGKFALPGGLAAFEAARDSLMALLGATDAVFYTDVNGTPRQYKKVYCHELTIENYSGGSADVTIVFMANDPFGYDSTSTVLANNVTVSGTPDDRTLNVGGTAPSQLPIITVTINSFTESSGTGIIRVEFTNNTNATAASYFNALSIGDVLQWDSANETFYYNGVRSSFTGTFPTLAIGSNQLTLETSALFGSLSAFNYTLRIEYTKRYT